MTLSVVKPVSLHHGPHKLTVALQELVEQLALLVMVRLGVAK